jgi:hypothetical protein
MKNEPVARIKIIQEELMSSRSDFWEFTDRGENFYYIEPELKSFMLTFFGWFDQHI